MQVSRVGAEILWQEVQQWQMQQWQMQQWQYQIWDSVAAVAVEKEMLDIGLCSSSGSTGSCISIEQ